MVYEFLMKYQEELISEKMEREEDYELLTSKIRENERFLELLEQENENIFSDFTPREVSYKNSDRMKEIKALLEKFYQNKNEAENNLKKINYRLNELSKVIDDVKSDNHPSKDNTNNEKKQESQNRLKHDLKNILAFMNQDVERAKIELNEIINKM